MRLSVPSSGIQETAKADPTKAKENSSLRKQWNFYKQRTFTVLSDNSNLLIKNQLID